jgi:outer membrane immunogenic protein
MTRRKTGSSSTWRRAAAAILAAASVLAATRASADDIPYLGPLAGLGNLPAPFSWLLPNYKTVVVPDWRGFTVNPLINYQTAQFTGAGGRFLRSAQGFTFGGEAGYNFQADRFVFGPVVDLSYSLMRADASTWIANINKADISWVGSARARVGYTFDRLMIYATGGVAFAQTKIDGPFVSSSQTAPGWTAGGGVQYLWSPSDIFQIEYRRLQIENKDFVALPRFQTKAGLAMNIINAGFLFKF